ncbi:MAG: glycoside hydrolase family 32 protein [Candidatus Brocadiia bacterium]
MTKGMSEARRRHQELADAATVAAQRGKERARQDPHRLAYHFMPPSGWINDPNGLIHWSGQYHLFYQHNPYAPNWGSMHWGHAVSRDLVHWRHLPVALAPGEPYEGGGGCFSGSAVDDDGTLSLLYTGSAPERQVQCLACSDDGVEFVKYPGNPVIADPPSDGSPEDFRDPKVWRHDGVWHMVVGTRGDGRGRALLYRSDNLRDWSYAGVLAESDGSQGSMWECPDLFPLGDGHVLVFSPIGVERRKAVYQVGEMGYGAGRFAADRQRDVDYGPAFYAPQTFRDERGRRIMFGWMTASWEERPTKAYGWEGAQTLPRLVEAGPEGGVRFRPVPEVAVLRGEHRRVDQMELDGEVPLPGIAGDSLELLAEFALGQGAECGLCVRCNPAGDESTGIIYNAEEGVLRVDAGASGRVDGGLGEAPLPLPADGLLRLHVFVDRSSVEVFGGDGRVVLSHRIYPGPESLGVRLTGRGATLRRLDAWELPSVW